MTARVRELLFRLRARRRLAVDDPIELWLSDLADLVLVDPDTPVPFRVAS